MMKFSTALVRSLTAGVLMVLAAPVGAQQAYPNKPIRLIVPFPPGGANNLLARLVGQKLGESWGQQVLVENRPGADGIIGAEALLKSPPDGYALMLVNSTHVTIPLLHRRVPFDAIRDFAPVATVSSSELILVLHPSVPANNLQEFIALAKSKPGQLNFASSGSATHLAGESFNIVAGVKMQHIPYKGGAPAITDLIGGQVQLAFAPPINVVPHIKSGRLRAIAITGGARFPALAQVPTLVEAGLPGFDVKAWYGVLAPVGTAKEIIDRLSAEIGKIMAMSDIKEKLDGQGMAPFISTPEQFAELMKADTAKYAKIIKTANIKIED